MCLPPLFLHASCSYDIATCIILAYCDSHTEPHEIRGQGVSATFREERTDDYRGKKKLNLICVVPNYDSLYCTLYIYVTLS